MSDAYRIPGSELPSNWDVEREQADEKGMSNEYAHGYLATELKVFGGGFDEEGLDRFTIELVSGGALAGMSYEFRSTGTIGEFAEARDYAIALMEYIEQYAQDGAEKPAEAALNEVNPLRHPAPSGKRDFVNDDQRCPICEVAFATYRGLGTYNQIENHFEHIEDESHRETEIQVVDNEEIEDID